MVPVVAVFLSCSNAENTSDEMSADYEMSGNMNSAVMTDDDYVEQLEAYLTTLTISDRTGGTVLPEWGKWLGVALVDAVGALTTDSTQNRTVRTTLFSLRAYDMLFNQHLDLETTIINILQNNAPVAPLLLPQTILSGSDSIGMYHNAMIDSVLSNPAVMQNFFEATSGEKTDITNSILISLGIGFTDSLTAEKRQEISTQAGVAERQYLISDTYEDLASNLRSHLDDFSLSLTDVNMIILYIQALDQSGENHYQLMNNAINQLQLYKMSTDRRNSLRSALIVGHASYCKVHNLFDTYSSLND